MIGREPMGRQRGRSRGVLDDPISGLVCIALGKGLKGIAID